jgi:hypothetical protein
MAALYASEVGSSGVQEFRSSGVQEFRSSGVQEFRSSGVQEFRSTVGRFEELQGDPFADDQIAKSLRGGPFIA